VEVVPNYYFDTFYGSAGFLMFIALTYWNNLTCWCALIITWFKSYV